MEYELSLYFFYECPYCQKVLRKIAELGLKSIKLCNILENKEYANKLIADTGRRTVPCLYINGTPMHESDDINKWLELNKGKLS